MLRKKKKHIQMKLSQITQLQKAIMGLDWPSPFCSAVTKYLKVCKYVCIFKKAYSAHSSRGQRIWHCIFYALARILWQMASH